MVDGAFSLASHAIAHANRPAEVGQAARTAEDFLTVKGVHILMLEPPPCARLCGKLAAWVTARVQESDCPSLVSVGAVLSD